MSSVPAVRAALVDLFEAAFAPLSYDVQVIPSAGSVTTMGENVLMLGSLAGQRSAGSRNRIQTTTRQVPFGTSQDEYTIEIFISVSRPLIGTEDIVEIADEIWETARAAVDDSGNLNIAGVVFEALPTGEFGFEPTGDANGRYVTVTWGVDITARD